MLHRHCIIGVPNAKRGEQNQKRPPRPYLLGDPQIGGIAMTPLHSQGPRSASAGNKIRSHCFTPAFSRAQKGAERLCHPCILGGPQR